MKSPTAMLERYDELPGWARWSINVGLLLGGWLLAALLLPDGAPPGRVLSGMILGAATALTSMGLILIYRSNRVVNFATGAMGAAAGVTAIRLFLIWNWNYALVFVVAVVAGIAVGFLTERLVIRRFDKASRLVLTVATIGLTQVLGGIELLLPTWVFGDDSTVTLGGFETPLSEYRFTVGVDVIDGNHLLILAVVPVVVGGLAWFLTRSQAGIAIRAAAENTDRARLLGIPVGRMQSLVWAIAGGLATLTLVLKSPFAGTPPSAGLGPAVLIPALAAAVIARMESLPVACIAALVLGAVDQVVRWNSSTPALVDVVMLFVILGALLLRRPGTSRAHDGDATWQDTAAVRPIPAVLARLPEIRITRIVAMVVLAATVILVPITLSPSTLNTLNVTVIWGIVALSLVVLTGWNGQVSLGQFALVGCGAIMAGNLMMRWNVDFFLALLAATAVGAVVAFLLGLPALRIRGPFLAVVTLSFAVVLDGYLLNPNNFPELIPQDVDRPVLWERWAMQNERVFFYVCVAVLALVVLCLRGVRRARSGRLLIAGRDNRKAAEAMSVPTRRMALTGFVFSGAIAGLAGGLHVTLLNGARVGSYPTVQSVEVFAMTTIGGLSSIGGGMSGALGLRGLQDAMPSTGARLLLLGTGLLVVLMIVPGGLASVAFGIRDRALRLIARRRGIAVAGLERDEELRAPTPAQAEEGGPEAVALEQGVFSTRNLDVSYGQLQVLFGVDFAVAEGEMVALLGTNGAGKSTLLKAMCGLVGSKGQVTFAGRSIRGHTPERIVREGVALMPGGRSIFPTLDVAEHLRLATWTFRGDRERIEADTREVLELFPGLQRRLHTLAGDLSGGEQQQLALAQTLLLRPRVLLIDELSLGLAPTVVALLLDVVRQLNRSGTTVIVVEQSVNVALSLADRAVFMEKGQVRFEGPTRELLDRPDILRSVFLEGAAALAGADGVSVHGSNGAGSTSEVPEMPAVDLSALEALSSLETAATTIGTAPVSTTNGTATNGATTNGTAINSGPPPILECTQVTKRFGGVIAVDGVDLVVQPGEIVGLVGQNGAGKTTLVDCISGFHRIDHGRIVFRGHDVTDWHPYERARGRLGRSFQEARLFPSLTVFETIAVACERQVSSRAFVADVFRQPASFESELEITERVDALIELLSLGDHRDKLTSELSTGTRRIVELACLLAEDPVLLLLDEPSAGVAQKETETLGPLLGRIRDVTGAAMVIIEHDMPLLAGLCDRLVALDLGAVIASGDAEKVLADELVVASYLGTDSVAINRSGVAASDA